MRALGLRGVTRGTVKRTTISDPAADRPGDLVGRNFHPPAPNRLWVADLTYVSTWSGWVYVAFVVDAYARRILGWRTATTMTTGTVLDALEQAIWTRQREGHADLSGLVHHNDRGSQYTSMRFGETTRRGRHRTLGRLRRRQLRQRPRRDDQRPLQDRVDQARQAVADRRRSRTCHRRMDRLVQPPPPLRVLRRRSARRTGDRSLCSTTSTANRCAVTPMSLRTCRCGSGTLCAGAWRFRGRVRRLGWWVGWCYGSARFDQVEHRFSEGVHEGERFRVWLSCKGCGGHPQEARTIRSMGNAWWVGCGTGLRTALTAASAIAPVGWCPVVSGG